MTWPHPSRQPPSHNRHDPHHLVTLAAAAAQATTAALDENYTVTAIMIGRRIPDGSTHHILVELLESTTGPEPHWTALAYDELRDIRIGPTSGTSPADALHELPWTLLDGEASPPNAEAFCLGNNGQSSA